jgi:hypothetical protein
MVGGKQTGQKVSHYIVPRGAYANLKATGLKLRWQSAPEGEEAKNTSKTKFTCPECGQNAWAKPEALLGCYACYEEREREEPVRMLAAPSDKDKA